MKIRIEKNKGTITEIINDDTNESIYFEEHDGTIFFETE